jgi:glutamine phosphoribosylpyrophosphate amidotransferase
MCAIIGFISDNPTAIAVETLKKVFIESKIRGMHAYGYAAIQDGVLMQHKSNGLKSLLTTINNPTRLIGHCRYSTSGDYKDMNNNQPLRFGDEYLVFNGVIDMRTKAEMEAAYKIKMQSDNDGEIMLQAENRIEMLKSGITFSGLTLKSHALAFFRNEGRPAYKATRHGATYIASTADILRRCLLEPEPLNPYEAYVWTT